MRIFTIRLALIDSLQQYIRYTSHVRSALEPALRSRAEPLHALDRPGTWSLKCVRIRNPDGRHEISHSVFYDIPSGTALIHIFSSDAKDLSLVSEASGIYSSLCFLSQPSACLGIFTQNASTLSSASYIHDTFNHPSWPRNDHPATCPL